MCVLPEDIRYMHPRLKSDYVLYFPYLGTLVIISPLHLTRAVASGDPDLSSS